MPIAVIAWLVIVGVRIDGVRLRSAGRIQRLRQAEVQDLHRAVGPHLDVGRLQIAMDDALSVRGVERVGNLPGDRQRLVERQGAARDAPGEVLALDQLHDERVLFDAVNGRDVRMIEGRERGGFALEPRPPLRVGRPCRRQDLDRDVALQARVLRAVHLAHSACPERTEDLVGAEPGTRGEAHEVLPRVEGPAPRGAQISQGPTRVPAGKVMCGSGGGL
jgi:hypothetical protein